MKVDSDTDVEEDMQSAGPSRNYILMKPWNFCLSSRGMENRVNKINERALRLVYADSRNVYLFSSYELKLTALVYIKEISKPSLQKYLKQTKGFQRKEF